MPGHPAEKLCTVDDFLAWDGEPDVHYELVNGRIVAMAPPSYDHGRIVLRIGRRLLERLPAGCEPIAPAGVRIPNRDDAYYEGDLVVTCSPQKPRTSWIEHPTLIVEILSPSTRTHDRGNKTPDYATIPSVQDILLVDSQRRWVQHWSRQADDVWVVRDIIGEGGVILGVLQGGALTLDEIYEGVL